MDVENKYEWREHTYNVLNTESKFECINFRREHAPTGLCGSMFCEEAIASVHELLERQCDE